ncbi:protein swsn isoform [Trichuris trichiura]|uniref:Protein swsn isoform n=1 Tax=Trichuris trichiura TaxID=36087 RepID=A0A077ZBT9_TRITR|nr:protein swsn isoform [Trichuris trichiura]
MYEFMALCAYDFMIIYATELKLAKHVAGTMSLAAMHRSRATAVSHAIVGEKRGLKLVLRLPSKSSLSQAASTSKTTSEEDENSDLELHSNDDDANEGEVPSKLSCGQSSSGSITKKKRKKRRFLFTAPPKGSKRRRIKAEANVESDDALVEKAKCSSKKSDENSADGESNETPHEVAETSTEPRPLSQSKAAFSPLQLLLDFYVRVFLKKDPDCYFTKPFSENDCKTIVNQTDFAAIQNKIAQDHYKTLIELKSDLELVVSNVLKLNDFSTEYRVAARKFTLVIDYMFSKEKMLSLQRALPGMHRVTAEQLGFSETPKQLHCLRKGKTNRCPLVVDDLTDEEVLCQAQTVSELAADLASSRAELTCPKLVPNRRTTLKMLTPNKIYRRDDNIGSSGSAKLKRPVLLSDIVGQLKEGNPGLLASCAEPRKEIPVTYLNYGPLSSFAPSYDSTWATLPKRETDFICSDSEKLLANFSARCHKLFASHHPECRVDLAEVFNSSTKTQVAQSINSADAHD